MTKKCERCGALPPMGGDGVRHFLDYCAKCSKDLCDRCMAGGCCGQKPALSGMREDNGEEEGA